MRAAVMEKWRCPADRDMELLARAVRTATPRLTRGYRPRWRAVMEVFGLGSMTAVVLCRRFKVDPHEEVRWDGRRRPAR